MPLSPPGLRRNAGAATTLLVTNNSANVMTDSHIDDTPARHARPVCRTANACRQGSAESSMQTNSGRGRLRYGSAHELLAHTCSGGGRQDNSYTVVSNNGRVLGLK